MATTASRSPEARAPGLLPELRAGALDGAGRRRLRRPLRPGRSLASRASSSGCSEGIGRRRARLQRCTDRQPRRRPGPALVLDGAAQQLHQLRARCCWRTQSPEPPRSSGAICCDDALPFPPLLAKAFHDHWLAVVALARGEIAYLDEPLYDYVQHGDAVIGHSCANKRPRPIRQHLIERLRRPTGRLAGVYYYDWHQQLLFCRGAAAALLGPHGIRQAASLRTACSRPTAASPVSPGCSAAVRAASGGTTRPSTGSCSTPTRCSVAGRSRCARLGADAPIACFRETPASRPGAERETFP